MGSPGDRQRTFVRLLLDTVPKMVTWSCSRNPSNSALLYVPVPFMTGGTFALSAVDFQHF